MKNTDEKPTITRCEGTDSTFQALTVELDEDLQARYGAQMDFFGRYNHASDVKNAVYACVDDAPAGCGCFKPFSDGTVEMKRVFVRKELRGRGIARAVMRALEAWARELGYQSAVLETGILQPEAIRLYEAAGYKRIPNYPPYENVKESVCYQKTL
ncbi:MAG: GNAT family N-acetyltransferase [Eubacteriales bacterium]|nr:GNAT family N-acetyltransferase [Eubacteriales bacterium]